MKVERLSPEKQRLVESLIPLAVHTAKRFSHDPEITSIAYHALCVAVSRYDPEKHNCSLTTYCYRYIKQRITRENKPHDIPAGSFADVPAPPRPEDFIHKLPDGHEDAALAILREAYRGD